MAKTKKCPQCGAEMTAEIRDHQFVESGLNNVMLKGVTVQVCPNGHELLAIPGLAQVHRALALAIVDHGQKLTGPEVKYLRKYLGRSNKDFAKLMGVSESQASRWASGAEDMGGSADHLLRVLVRGGFKPASYPIDESAAKPDSESSRLMEEFLLTVAERKEMAGDNTESRIALKRRSNKWQAEAEAEATL